MANQTCAYLIPSFNFDLVLALITTLCLAGTKLGAQSFLIHQELEQKCE